MISLIFYFGHAFAISYKSRWRVLPGKLEEVVTHVWRDIECTLLSLSPLQHAASLSPENWASLFADLRACQAHIAALLQVKTQFWKSLPWCLVGLAHGDAQIVRQMATSAIAQFEKDPRREAHHRITWHWMNPAGPLRNSVDFLAKGVITVLECPAHVVKSIARLRFVVVVETTIENKHARVTMARRKHTIGPVRVSLSNRLLMLDSRMHCLP